MSAWWQLGIGLAGMASIMGLLWTIQLRSRNANAVDAAWSGGIGLMAVFLALSSDGEVGRRILMAVLAGIWSLRLTGYLFQDRIVAHGEDGRYSSLRQAWGPVANRKFFFFFQFQAVLVVVLSLPLLVVAHSRAPLGLLDWAGFVLGLGAVAGETIADRQLARFRRNPANRGRTCREGLWRFSRHPNYFFEWFHWFAYLLLGAASTEWWLTLIGPALMLFFIFKVTGIPATEERALASRGEDYRRYQQTTSAFIPWFPKKEGR